MDFPTFLQHWLMSQDGYQTDKADKDKDKEEEEGESKEEAGGAAVVPTTHGSGPG